VADLLHTVASLRTAATAAAEAAVAEAEAHLAVVKSLRTVIQNYDQALAVLTQPNQPPADAQ
jgi:hypothetical protein